MGIVGSGVVCGGREVKGGGAVRVEVVVVVEEGVEVEESGGTGRLEGVFSAEEEEESRLRLRELSSEVDIVISPSFAFSVVVIVEGLESGVAKSGIAQTVIFSSLNTGGGSATSGVEEVAPVPVPESEGAGRDGQGVSWTFRRRVSLVHTRIERK